MTPRRKSRILMICWGLILDFGSCILIFKFRSGTLIASKRPMKGARRISVLRLLCCLISPTFYGPMLTFRKFLESFSLLLTLLNGRVCTKFGYLTFINLSQDTVMMLSELKEQDQCSKDYLRVVQTNIWAFFTIYMRNSSNSTGWFHTQLIYTTRW